MDKIDHLTIAEFSKKRAKHFSLKLLGFAMLTIVPLVFLAGAYYHHSRLSHTVNLIAHALAEPLALGGDYLASRVVSGLTETNYFHDVWILDKDGRLSTDQHEQPFEIDLESIKEKNVFWHHGHPHFLAKRDIYFLDNKVGTILVSYVFPVGWFLAFTMIMLFSSLALLGFIRNYFGNFSRELTAPFIDYHRFLEQKVGKDEFLDKKASWSLAEINYFHETLAKLQRQQRKSENLVRRAITNAQLSKITSRVKHDIIAAMAIADTALERIENNYSPVSMLRSVLERISSIVEDIPKMGVLTDNEMKEAATPFPRISTVARDPMRKCHVVSFVQQVVGEVRGSSFCRAKKIDFKLDYDPSIFELFIDVEADKFKRDVFNILKNSVEAIEISGEIKVFIEHIGHSVRILIQDNGCGIPPERLAKIGRRGISFDKPDGSGIGVAATIEDLKRWGGEFNIESQQGVGSKVSIILPLTDPDLLFPTKVLIAPESKVVVVDDDPLVHDLWKDVFAKIVPENEGVEVSYFQSLNEAKEFLQKIPKESELLVLTDYDLRDKNQSGIDLICELNLERSSILVTANGTNNSLYEQCKKAKLQLMPKSILTQIPVTIV